MSDEIERRVQAGEVDVVAVDCDVHNMAILDEVVDYVPEPWRSRYFRDDPGEIDFAPSIYEPPLHVLRLDSTPPSGGLPGSDPAFLEKQVLREGGVDFAMLFCLVPKAKLGQPDFESALFSGMNSWQGDTWLGAYNHHERYRGAIRVSPYDPPRAVAEIEKWSGHPYVAQVYMIPEAAAPFGQPRFRPILRAAEKADLPIALHVMRTPGMRLLTPVGFPSYHLEIFPQWPLYFMGHFASMLFEGVFDELPGLKVVAVEGGFSWATPFIWRLDRYWEALGREKSGCRRRPSEVLAEHVRFTSQPVEEPSPGKALHRFMDWLDASQMLMFASDYPHYDYDSPKWLGPRLSAESRERIFAKNAIEFYGLPSKRPLDEIDRIEDAPPRGVVAVR